MNSRTWTVYIIQSESGKLYTGITTDMESRFAAHKAQTGAKFFRTSGPVKVVYQEKQPDRSSATRREMQIKKMTRTEKLKLADQ